MTYTIQPTVAQARARTAALTRHNGADAPDTLAARGELAAANLAAYIEKTVAAAPQLTADQRSRIAALLGGGA
jgi:hypothetical protein